MVHLAVSKRQNRQIVKSGDDRRYGDEDYGKMLVFKRFSK